MAKVQAAAMMPFLALSEVHTCTLMGMWCVKDAPNPFSLVKQKTRPKGCSFVLHKKKGK